MLTKLLATQEEKLFTLPSLIAFALLSFLFSYALIFYGEPINSDGIRYLTAAETFSASGLGHLFTVFSWPFYPVLISIVSNLLHLSSIHSAQLINSFLFLLLGIAFVALLSAFDKRRHFLLLGVLLLFSFPHLNHYRPFVIRDVGGWAFLCAGVYLLLEGINTERRTRILMAYAAFMFGFLFRAELCLAFFLPSIAYLLHRKQVGKDVALFCLVVPVLLAITLVMVLFTATWLAPNSLLVGKLTWFFNHLIHGREHILAFQQAAATELTSRHFSMFDAMRIISYGQGVFIFEKLIAGLSLFFTALAIYGYVSLKCKNNANFLLLSAALLLIPVYLHALEGGAVSGRYLIPSVLMLLPLSVLGLQSVLVLPWRNWRIPVKVLTILLIVMGTVSSLYYFGTRKTYMTEAGKWLVQHLPDNAQIATNSDILQFYMRHGTTLTSPDKMQSNNDVTVLLLSHRETKPVGSWGNLCKKFQNKKGDEVVVYTKHKGLLKC